MDFLINPIYDTYISCGTFCDECICNNGSCKERHGWDICISDCSKNSWELVCGRGVARRITA